MSMINEFVSKHLSDYRRRYPKSDKLEKELSDFVSYFKGINGYKPYSLERAREGI